MNVQHLDPEKCKPSEILPSPATTRAAHLRKDYTLFGKGAMFHVVVHCSTDGEFRICVPLSDVIDGHFDEGVRLLLDIGGERAQRTLQLTVDMNRRLLVPLVLVFTKFDLIVPKVSSAGGNDNGRVRAAYTTHERQCRSLFRDVPAEIISSDDSSYVFFGEVVSRRALFSAQPRFRDLTDKLVQTTDGLIVAHSRKVAASSEAQRLQPRMSLVPLAWSVSQRASRDINILTAIE